MSTFANVRSGRTGARWHTPRGPVFSQRFLCLTRSVLPYLRYPFPLSASSDVAAWPWARKRGRLSPAQPRSSSRVRAMYLVWLPSAADSHSEVARCQSHPCHQGFSDACHDMYRMFCDRTLASGERKSMLSWLQKSTVCRMKGMRSFWPSTVQQQSSSTRRPRLWGSRVTGRLDTQLTPCLKRSCPRVPSILDEVIAQ